MLVLIASTVCYLWAVVLLVVAVEALAPVFSHRFGLGGAAFPSIVIMIAVTYCVTGYFISRRRRLGAWLGVIVAILTAALQSVIHLAINWISLTPGWLTIDAVLLVLVVASWRRYDQDARGVGA